MICGFVRLTLEGHHEAIEELRSENYTWFAIIYVCTLGTSQKESLLRLIPPCLDIVSSRHTYATTCEHPTGGDR
jgi:hypothetical protein